MSIKGIPPSKCNEPSNKLRSYLEGVEMMSWEPKRRVTKCLEGLTGGHCLLEKEKPDELSTMKMSFAV